MKINKCLWCNSQDLKKVSKRVDGKTILQCQSCKLLMVDDIPKDSSDLYQKDYFQKQTASQIGYTNYLKSSAANLMGKAALIELLKSDAAEKYLDIGCADGSLLEVIKQDNSRDIYGLEISEYAVNIAKGKGLNVIKSDLKKTSFESSKFDVISAFDLIEHLSSPKETMKEIKRILSEDGVFIFSTLSIDRISQEEYWFNNSLEHFIYFDSEGLTRLLEEVFGKSNVYSVKVSNNGISETLGVAKNKSISQPEREILDIISHRPSQKKLSSKQKFYLSLLYVQFSNFSEGREINEELKGKISVSDETLLTFFNLYFQGKFADARKVVDEKLERISLDYPVFWQAYSEVLTFLGEDRIKELNKQLKEWEGKTEIAENRAFVAEEEVKYLKCSRLIGPVIRLRDTLRNTQKRVKDLRPKLRVIMGKYLPPTVKRATKYVFHREWMIRTVIVKNEEWDKKLPLVTVVTSTYNRGPAISKTIESVLAQTFQNFEHIIFDDGSSVANQEYLRSIDEPKIRVIFNKKNAGSGSPAIGRNQAIKNAKGRYIISLDDDDWIEPTYIEKAIAVLESNPNVALATAYQEMFGAKKCIYKYGAYNPKDLLVDNRVMQAAMYPRKAWEEVGGYKPSIGYEDWEFWINLAESGFWGKLIPEALLHYFVSPKSRYMEDLDKHHENVKTIRALHPEFSSKIRQLQRKRKYKNLEYSPKDLFINLRSSDYYLKPRNTNKSILIAIPWMTFGGAETLIYNYCHEIKNDFNISFVTGLQSENEWEYKFKEISQNIYHLANLFGDETRYLEFISNYIKTRNIDVLHIIHNNFVYGMLKELKARHPKLKVIVTLFNDRVDHFSKVFQYEDHIDAFSADNQKVINSLKKGLKGKDNKLVKIPNGIDCNNTFNQQKFDRSAQRSELGLEDDELAVFFVGRLSSEKMPDAFLEAAGKVVKNPKNQKVRFFVIGDGLMRAEIEDKIGKINSENIKYLGYQSDVAKYLSAGDIFVLPSIIEGFPLSILEAMAMKMNVIASDVGAISDIIKDGKDGFIVKPASVDEIAANIEKLNQDRDLLHKVAENARKVVESNYSTEVLGKRYSSLYMEK